MTPSILSLTFNGLTSLNRAKPEINTSKSETDPKNLQKNHFMLDMSEKNAYYVSSKTKQTI